MTWVDADIEGRISEHLRAADLDGAATEALRGYGPQLLGYLTVVLRSEDRADEAFSVFSEDLWKGLPGFRGESSFATWAYKLAWHAASRVLRDPYQRRQVPIPSPSVLAARDEVRTRTAVHLRSEVKSAVHELRQSLDAEEQALLVLRVDRGMPWEDVADVLGIGAASARKRFERLKAKLRKLAAAQGIGEVEP